MYLNNLVVAIKHNDKVLREKSNKVILPFDSEYSILVKNLNSKKVSVNISIDGDDVLDNKSLLIKPNSSAELDGFMDGMSAKNRFRFIKKTKQISNYRGDKADDGLIRVEFAYEATYSWSYTQNYWPRYYDLDDRYRYSDSGTSCNTDGVIRKSSGFSNKRIGSVSNCMRTSCIKDDGITVKGSEINQNFTYGNIGTLEESNVMIIHLCGEKINGTVVSKPITVKTRLRCKTCGTFSRSNAKFCRNCGTFLE